MGRNATVAAVVLACSGLLTGIALSDGAPMIEFLSVPAYGSSGDLTGRVSNVVYSNHAVAVYIFVGGWWNKPYWETPLRSIGTSGVWSCDVTTFGSDVYATQIAAFLVPTGTVPPQAEGWAQLPADFVSNALAEARAPRPFTRRFWFSGYEWSVKDSGESTTGPGNNYFSDSTSNVWIDAQGCLHLKIAKRSGRWYCAEVVSVRSFGYGTYRVFLDTSADGLDTNAVLGLFTWNDDAPYAHREIDVEITRWQDAADTNNSQFVVQPWDQPGHLVRRRVPPTAATSTHSFAWSSGRVDFASHAGAYAIPPAANETTASWTFSGDGVPQAGWENYRMNLWLSNTSGTTDGNDEEVVISRFVFVPEPIPQPAWMTPGVLTGGVFAAAVTTEPQLTVSFQASTNLAQWVTQAMVTVTGATDVFTDTNAVSHPMRFYRIGVPPQ